MIYNHQIKIIYGAIFFPIVLIFLMLPLGCTKQESGAEISDEVSITLISVNSASVTGKITNPGDGISDYGHCYATSSNPTYAGSKTSFGISYRTRSYSSDITGLSPNTLYYVRAYLKSGNDLKYSSEVSFTTNSPGNTVIDLEGNIYNTVTIGTQTWLAENLKSTKYNDGTEIPNVTDSITWSALSTGAYCDYDNNPSNSDTYGRLYNWFAAASTNTRNICPTGWHVPSDAEWKTLTDYLGGETIAGGKLKESGTTHWYSPNYAANNLTGFTALPGGSRSYDGAFGVSIGDSGFWWSSIERNNDSFAWLRRMDSNFSFVLRTNLYLTYGFSVRCVKDY